MDPVTIAGLVSSIITILKTTQEIYDAANNQSGLPEAFQVVATRLGAVTTILPTVGASIEHVDEVELRESHVKLLKSCESQCAKLHEIFDKVVPAADASRMQRYLSVARAMKIGRAARVEDLMKSIITDIHAISMNLGFFKSAPEVQSLLQAQDAVEKLGPSLPDEELNRAHHITNNNNNNNTGNGSLYNVSGSGSMTNFSNYASQHNYSGSAPVHHVQNAYYGPPPKPFPANKLLKASPPVNLPSEDLKRLRHKSEPTAATYDWLTSVTEYNEWLNSTTELPILVITGPPGSGKTCVSMSWTSTFCVTPSREHTTTCAYYFCDDKDKGRSTGTAVLRGLLYQICNANLHVTIPNELLRRDWEAWVNEGEGQPPLSDSSDDNMDRNQWWNDFNKLWALFEEIVTQPDAGNFILLIDAIDEYEESTRNLLLERLSLFQADYKRTSPQGKVQGKVKILLTCRQDRDIRVARIEHRHIRLKIGPENELLGPHIKESIEYIFQPCHFESSFTKGRIDQVQRIAEGTFLWVSFLLSDLSKICKDRSFSREEKRIRIDDTIQTMPTELAEKYDQILDGIQKGDSSETSTILQILALAARPMTKDEVRTAFELIKMPWEQLHHPTGDIWTKEDEEHMYESCADLVHVYEDAPGRKTVSLIHQSLKLHLLHLDRHDKKKLLNYVGTLQLVVKWTIHAVCLTLLGVGIRNTATGFTDEPHIIVLCFFFSTFYLTNLCIGCVLFLRQVFSAGHQDFDLWKAINFGAHRDLLTAEHSLEHIMWWLFMSLAFTTQAATFAINLSLEVVVDAFPGVANWTKPVGLRSLPGSFKAFLAIAAMYFFLPELSQLAETYWESTGGRVVTRRRAHRLLWEVCAKRMIIFLAGQTEAGTSSRKHESTKRSQIMTIPDDTQHLEGRLKWDDLFTYAVKNMKFHVYQLSRGMDYQGYRKLSLPCDRKALDCYPRFRGWWLNLSCHDGDAPVVQALLQYGADPNQVNILNPLIVPHVYCTPITSAMSSKQESSEVLQHLLDHDAVVSTRQQYWLDRIYPSVTRKSRMRRNWDKLVSSHFAVGLLIQVFFTGIILFSLLLTACLIEIWTGAVGLIQPVFLVFAIGGYIWGLFGI